MRAGIIRAAGRVLAVLGLCAGVSQTTGALEIVLDDVAADRIERQRRFNRNELPLPGTPDLAKLDERLETRDLAKGRAIYIRIFKAESELELWMQNSKGTFSRLATYPICHWYGSLGPKLKEGDKQSPEGFYRVGAPQTRLVGRWRKAFNLGFPNLHDQRLNRTGSYILLHGGCSSVGCFAMTDPVQDEIYELARAALEKGQERFSVHIFPFRMTAENLERFKDHEGAATWADLKPAYDSFERTHVPPRVALCGSRYKIADGLPGETGDTERRLSILRPAAANAPARATEADGDWTAPACQLDDEDRRIAHYSEGPTTTSATMTATADTVPAEPTSSKAETDAVETGTIETSARPPPAVHAASDNERSRARQSERAPAPKRGSPPHRVRAASRPLRRDAGQQARTGVSAADGFGSSALHGTQRISSHGG
ncbi:MAG: murein L,D-transpeptidase family protein [Hyphomicrobiaceae bacterium]